MTGGEHPTADGGASLVSFLQEYTLPPRILVVEDDEQVRNLLLTTLSRFSCELVPAADGMTAIALLRGGRFDLIVTDLRLPDLHYTHLADAIEETQPQTPVVIMSGFIDGEALWRLTEKLDRPLWFIRKPAEISRERFERIFASFRLRATLKDSVGIPLIR